MFQTPYDTTAGSLTSPVAIKETLERYYLLPGEKKQLKAIEEQEDTSGDQLLQFVSGPLDVPYWTHPIEIELKDKNKTLTIVDVRGFTGVDRVGQLLVKSNLDYDFAMVRTKLQNCWHTLGPEKMMNWGPIQVSLYANWLTEGLMYAFRIDPEVQIKVRVIAAAFYLSLFGDGGMKKDQAHRWSVIIGRAIGMNAGAVYDILTVLSPMANLEEFIFVVKEATGSISLEDLNKKTIYEILGRSWFGYQSNQLVCAALEYPPLWISLVYTAATERGYQKSRIGDILKRYDNNFKVSGELIKSVNAALSVA